MEESEMVSLSEAEKAQYGKEGYVVPKYRLPAEKVDRMRATLDKLIADNPGVRPEKLVSAHVDGHNGEGVKGSSDFLALARRSGLLARPRARAEGALARQR